MAKYIVTRSDGTPIPEDEPYFVIRAKDVFALRAVQMYIDMTLDAVSEETTSELIKHRERIRTWRNNNLEQIKVPD